MPRLLFGGLGRKSGMKLVKTRNFKSGNVLLCYEPEKKVKK
ncbi:MAG TPA: hypothetical protein VLD37_04485 [Candidatus Bilamarchaeum sp.]|nr:hypothetical protein [Candidatus Bilamarchaeum sp.]